MSFWQQRKKKDVFDCAFQVWFEAKTDAEVMDYLRLWG